MVSLSEVRASNFLIPSHLPPGLVAVFVGGTSGIGEISVKTLAKYSRKPRIYVVGRDQGAATRIFAECQALNPEGDFIFIKADVSLIRRVDELCDEIKRREKTLNLLFLSAGVPSMDKSETTEKLHLLAALNYHSRVRIIQNLLPLLQAATFLRRVVTVGGGGFEGNLDPNDFQALHAPLPELRERLTTLVTLGLEAVSKLAPEVSMVHNYPGTVKTPLLNHMPEEMEEMLKQATFVPLNECGERHVYLATSAKYPPKSGEIIAVPLGDSDSIALGSTGEAGSGVYSIRADCENSPEEVLQKLANLREKGMVDAVWRYTQEEFRRITEETTSL